LKSSTKSSFENQSETNTLDIFNASRTVLNNKNTQLFRTNSASYKFLREQKKIIESEKKNIINHPKSEKKIKSEILSLLCVVLKSCLKN